MWYNVKKRFKEDLHMSEKCRLITRSDFDGLVCAMILKELDLIEDIKFVHPKDMQDGKIPVTDKDITTNLPYVPGVKLAFDHHSSEETRAGGSKPNHIIDGAAPSAARVVYNYYGGRKKLPRITDEIMEAVDKADSAQFTMEDILNPQGWVLLSYLMDARTGLGRFHSFRISNYDLMMELIDYCLEHTIKEILDLPDVKERVDMYFEQQELFKAQIERVHKIVGDVVVLPLKEEETIYTGNRFLVYAMYPETKISVHVMWGFQKQNTAVTIGKSIVNRSSKVDIGEICLKYGGGGHKNAGTCQLPNDEVDKILPDILELLNQG
ncbi:exopolyphosphatase [Acetivibrio ethanolgignens]|uniref:Exopolyphosphatase n=2 Tax=Acetivibrio ethanolgignens TaxID=290052 RepID=A0A0V8QDZ2_9FIRM|nr:exopolyphosphatase [Acetivibrio ethanolgignens]